MAVEYTEVLDINASQVPISNNSAEVTVYNAEILGGTLGLANMLRLTLRGIISFSTTTAVLTVRLKYGTTPLTATITFSTNGSVPANNKGFVIEAGLSADGSASLQVAHMSGQLELPLAEIDGVLVGAASGSEDSSQDKDLIVTFQWNEAAAGNTVTKQHASLERLSFTADVEIPDSVAPGTKILTLSPLNLLPHSIFKDVVFYAPLLHDFKFLGSGSAATFTRASASTAVWRDGASHSVAANEGRFSYNGANPRGLLFDAGAGESLTFPSTNLLSNGNSLYWIQNDVIMRAPPDSNPINASGLWIGSNNVYIREILKMKIVVSDTRTDTIIKQALQTIF